jgi:Tfp pilus assembly protein PilE
MMNKKGITLIALIITVIIMLILAGVSLNAILRRQWYCI